MNITRHSTPDPMRTALCCLVLLLCATAPTLAQSSGAAEYFSSAQLQAEVDTAASAAAGLINRRLGDRSDYTYSIIRRDRSGEAEVHDAWDDVILVRSGAGTLLHGGTVSGGRQTAPGETRGGEMTAEVAQPVAAGDMVIVPAGVPHRFELAPGQSITYLILKVQASSGTQ